MIVPNRFSLKEPQYKYLRRAVVSFFIGCIGVAVGFLSDRYSLAFLGQAAFLVVFMTVVCGIAFLLIGLLSSPSKKDSGSNNSGPARD
jgi:hypothetical protein